MHFTNLKKLHSKQKHPICIVDNKAKLNVYQLNILNNVRDDTHTTCMKISKTPHNPPSYPQESSLSIQVQNFSIHLTLDIQFQTNFPLSPSDNQSIKRKHNPKMTIYVIRSSLQINFRLHYQHINLFCLSFDFFSFS